MNWEEPVTKLLGTAALALVAAMAPLGLAVGQTHDLERKIYDKMGLQPGDKKGLEAALANMTPGQDRFGTYYELPGKIRVRFLRPIAPL